MSVPQSPSPPPTLCQFGQDFSAWVLIWGKIAYWLLRVFHSILSHWSLALVVPHQSVADPGESPPPYFYTKLNSWRPLPPLTPPPPPPAYLKVWIRHCQWHEYSHSWIRKDFLLLCQYLTDWSLNALRFFHISHPYSCLSFIIFGNCWNNFVVGSIEDKFKLNFQWIYSLRLGARLVLITGCQASPVFL